MAYRRNKGIARSATFNEARSPQPDEAEWAAISSLATPKGGSGSGSGSGRGPGPTYDYTSMGSSNETGSFWGVLARKAKAILEDDDMKSADNLGQSRPDFYSPRASQISKKLDTPTYSPASIGKEGGGGMTNVGLKESRKIEIVRKGAYEGYEVMSSPGQSPLHKSINNKNPTTQDDQLKAARDVAMATAAKAKLLVRELKTIRADMAFTKQRCSELEQENKILRDNNPDDDDDMIRRQLETLLAEKARLSHENEVYARENRVLREIVEYHQMTMQDVIYVDEATEEVTQVYPSSFSMPDSPTSSPPPAYLFRSASAAAKILPDSPMFIDSPPSSAPSRIPPPHKFL